MFHTWILILAPCTDEYPSLRITLAGGRDSTEGLLQVEYQGRKGAVCGDGWSMSAAAVACRQLGYTAALRTSSGEEFGGSPGYMWMSYVTCNGSEEKLQECTHSGLDDFSKSCTHPIGVGVVCGGVSPHAAHAWHVSGSTHTVQRHTFSLLVLFSSYDCIYCSAYPCTQILPFRHPFPT